MKTGKKVIIFSLLFAAAAALALYPFFANAYNSYIDDQLIVEYEENVSDMSNEDYESLFEAAYAWNEELYTLTQPSYFPETLTDSEIYESLLNINGDGMIGYIVIPSIDLSLSIYHYTTDEVLSKGAGHMESSALPVGGENTHCVITAHRGLASARMFTDLDQLETGDIFYLKVLGETFAYEVCEIREVDPDETSYLLPQEGRDLCTLVTCTPYGINTQRLLVTGQRVEYTQEEYEAEASGAGALSEAFKADYILIILVLVEAAVYALIIVYILRKRKPGRINA